MDDYNYTDLYFSTRNNWIRLFLPRPRRNGDEPTSTCIIIWITFPHPVMNQCKYTLSVKKYISFWEERTQIEVQRISSAPKCTLRCTCIIRFSWNAMHFTLKCIALSLEVHFASLAVYCTSYEVYWLGCIRSHMTLIVGHRESQGIHAAFLLIPTTLMYRSNPKDLPWLVLNTDLTVFCLECTGSYKAQMIDENR